MKRTNFTSPWLKTQYVVLKSHLAKGTTLLQGFILCFLLCSLNPASLNAQTIQFEEVAGTPFNGVKASSSTFADVDGDNDQDVLITGYNASGVPIAKLYTNDGSGNYTEVLGTPFEGVWDGSIAFTDVDGDNDQDVLITGLNNSRVAISKLYSNDGNGFFAEVPSPFEGVYYSSIAFSDVDGDNDQDVLLNGFSTDKSERVGKLYLNDGSGNFSEVTGTPFGRVFSGYIAFADIDGDNDEDVLVTGDYFPPLRSAPSVKSAKLYTNDGSGNFTEVAGTPFVGNNNGSIAFADVDGDNDLDVLITGDAPKNNRIAKLYTNNGSGTFTEVIGTPLVGVFHSSIAFADVDGDNDQDVLITGLNPSTNPIAELYANNGSGTFTKVNDLFGAVWKGSIAFADVDGDNDPDVLITGSNSSSKNAANIAKLYRNTTPPPPTCNIPTTLIASAITNTTAMLTWNDVNLGGDYEVQYRLNNNSQPWANVVVVASSTLNITGLLPGTKYKYRVRGNCDFGGTLVTTDFSSIAKFTTTVGAGTRVAGGETSTTPTSVEDQAVISNLETVADLQVYPTVTTDQVTISFTPIEKGRGILLMYGMQGKEMARIGFDNALQTTLSIGKEGKGIYIARIIYNEKTYEERIIVQ
jgi:VCBS repeat protein/fibronectin type III domain protein